ncbi:ferroportin-like [Littorina saxatilis]|uniref:Solute carrier family 40 member n=1 Tax=Littorina saxatilis TaxID=31220 RepID=A0AAN9BNP6_9CAEN
MCSSLKKWVTGTNFIVYVSHFLSAWGDRMWSFGVGLFLVNIASNDLQLPAIYGLCTCLTIFLLGATVGHWVDITPRLKAAQLALILQNTFVVICAAGVYAFLWFQHDIIVSEKREWLVPLCQAGIIVFAIFADLASLARMIAVERDWIVEICGKDKDLLAKMTASLRRIDQGTLILAPIATGQIMTYAGLENGAVFIAAWNVASVVIEYYLIWKVYNTVPALRAKKDLTRTDKLKKEEAEEGIDLANEAETANQALTSDTNLSREVKPVVSLDSTHSGDDSNDVDAETASKSPASEMASAGDAKLSVSPGHAQADDSVENKVMELQSHHLETEREKPDLAGKEVEIADDKGKTKKSGCSKMFICSQLLTLYRGWRTYVRYSVALAGLGLACLYMTVLGFDNITVAYAVTQGVSESILGIVMGASAVFGILGTFAYPALRRRLGLVRTGIFALSALVACLVLCVVSIWMPGSPFDPLYYIHPPQVPVCHNATTSVPSAKLPVINNNTAAYNVSISATLLPFLVTDSGNGTDTICVGTETDGPESYLSVGLLLAGIVTARFGLWIADLTITQLFLEDVAEGERGIVNGVQSSLNKLMDVLKFVLVVAVPHVQTFGYLVIVSFIFICLGWLSYAIFLRKNRGHFFHFEKCVGRDTANGHAVPTAA